VLIPLDVMSPFRHVVATHQPHIGSLATNDHGIAAMMLRMGGTMPPSVLILPIVLRDRVVAVVVAHRASMDIKLADVTEILPLANAASDALGRLIVKQKAASQRAMQAVPVSLADMGVTKRIRHVGSAPVAVSEAPARTSSPGLPLPAPSASSPSLPVMRPGTDPPAEVAPRAPIEDVLWAIESGREGSAQTEAALVELVTRAREAIPALSERFPGKLRVDRFAVTGRALRPAQYGGLLEAMVRLGGAAADLLIQKLDAPQRDVRFYAAVCAVEMRPRSAVPILAERLFDQDYGVRAGALEALAGYAPSELEAAFTRARAAINSKDPENVSAAASAIVAMGDVGSIADLINAVERGGRVGEHVRRALVSLTAQDFGTSERKWRKWWDSSRQRHRIEWLIEGLSHREDTIREAAIHDLRRLTGEYFGYHHDLPRREREAAAERWASWWRDTGQRRFASTEGDRNRPAAKPPGRDE
jgi:hypothetical protein